MVENVKGMLDKIDEDIRLEVEKEVQLSDESIKACAKEAYDRAVEGCIANIKERVSAKYAVARGYLEQLLEMEKPEQADAAPEAPAEEPALAE